MSIFERYNQSQAEKKHQQAVNDAPNIYQIREHDGELWLTYNDSLVCPCSMLKQPPVESIKTMRELYINRCSV